jgi:hypothetical protein
VNSVQVRHRHGTRRPDEGGRHGTAIGGLPSGSDEKNAIGDDNLVTTTDYPHGDSKYPKAMDRFLALPLSEQSKKKILWDNALRLYAL